MELERRKKKKRSLESIMLMSEEYRKELTRLTREKADKMALTNEKERGKLLYKEDVERVWLQTILTIRSQLLSIPSKLGSQLAVVDNAKDVTKILQEAIDDTLKELQKGNIIENAIC